MPARAIDDVAQRRRLAGEELSEGEPRHGRDDAARRQPLVAGLHGDDGVAVQQNLAVDARADRSAVTFDELARRLRVHQVQRPGRKRDGRRARIAAEHLRQHARERRAPRPAFGGWLSAASASGSQSISRSRAVWPLRISQCSTVSPGEAAFIVAPGSSSSARELQRRRPCRAPTAGRATTGRPSRECRRRGGTAAAAPAREARAPSGAVDHRDRELRLQADVVAGADVAQECERVGVAAEQHVLAVVDQLAGLAIRERGRASAEARARFEHAARVLPRLVRRTAALRPANAGADDDDIEVSCDARFIMSGPDPLSERDQRLPRARHAGPRVEHIVAAALDALQRLEVDGSHDLSGHQPPAILGRQRGSRALVEVARAAALELDQPPDRFASRRRRPGRPPYTHAPADRRAAGRRARARGPS